MNVYMTKEKVIALYPHGRLVDADAKVKELEKEKEHYEMRLKNARRYKKQGCSYGIDKQIENFEENIRDCKYLIRVLNNMPTVIEKG